MKELTKLVTVYIFSKIFTLHKYMHFFFKKRILQKSIFYFVNYPLRVYNICINKYKFNKQNLILNIFINIVPLTKCDEFSEFFIVRQFIVFPSIS